MLVNGGHRSNGGTKYIATAPSLEMVEGLLERLIENVQDLSSDYERFMEKVQDDGQLIETEIQVSSWVFSKEI